MNKTFSTYSVIPTEIILSKEISSTSKILYGVISSLTNEKGYCWASNEYIGELLGLSERQISRGISELTDQQFIVNEVEQNYKRKITLTTMIRGTTKMSRGYDKKDVGVRQKCPHNNIKEYYKKNINNIAETSSAEEVIPDLVNDKQKHIQIIGLYALGKGIKFESKKQQQDFIKRNLRSANQIKSYQIERIKDTMRYLIKNADFKWTIESVGKYIDEDLTKLRQKNNIVII